MMGMGWRQGCSYISINKELTLSLSSFPSPGFTLFSIERDLEDLLRALNKIYRRIPDHF